MYLLWLDKNLSLKNNPEWSDLLQELHNSAKTSGSAGGVSEVVAFYVVSPDFWITHGEATAKLKLRQKILLGLHEELKTAGIELMIVHVNSANQIMPALLDLCQQMRATHLFVGESLEWDERQLKTSLKRNLEKQKIKMTISPVSRLFNPGMVLKQDGSPYSVFTPFRNHALKQWLENPHALQKISTRVKTPKLNIAATPAFHGTHWSWVPVASKEGQKLWPRWAEYQAESLRYFFTSWGLAEDLITTEDLKHMSMKQHAESSTHQELTHKRALNFLRSFLHHSIENYRELRDIPHAAATSGLSVFLNNGLLSARECMDELLRIHPTATADLLSGQAGGPATWLNELLWRDFYHQILTYHPHLGRHQPFQRHTRNIPWRKPEKEIRAWMLGQTGYPFVDAGMRQLLTTGLMHNRLRMVTAMFFAKHLLADWRIGEHYFMLNLIDGDFAANNGGWQWCASTGTDAAPYFRVFNPLSQGKKYDPEAHYIQEWIPELSLCSPKQIHSLKDLPAEYALPVVEHSKARERVLKTFGKLTKG